MTSLQSFDRPRPIKRRGWLLAKPAGAVLMDSGNNPSLADVSEKSRFHLLRDVCAALGAMIAFTLPAFAQSSIYQEQYKLIHAPNAVTSLGQGLFGDKVNLYTGSLEFVQIDVSLPGNNKLPVAVGRRLITGNYGLSVPKQFGTWDLEIPHLHGVFSASNGWTDISSTNQRCTNYGAPPTVSGSGTSMWSPGEYWHGSFMYVPGVGDQEILRSTSPSLSPATLITRDLWTFTCNNLQSVNTYARDNGQGFTAVSPDGTSYRFDWLATRVQDPIEKDTDAPQVMAAESAPSGATVDAKKGHSPTPYISGSNILQRREVWIMPTQVTDRFGNWVRYTYDTTDLWKVTRIESSDGRVITLQYNNPGTQQITSVSDGTRIWYYSYSGGALNVVTLPDNSTWQLDGTTALLMDLGYSEGRFGCDDPGNFVSSPLTASMVHPSGATGTFTLTPTHHGRSYVMHDCRLDINNQPAYATFPRVFDTFSLTQKTLTGPGLPGGGLAWTYAYGAPNASWADCSGCTDVKFVMVTAPDNFVTRYTFGNHYLVSEGLLLREEAGLPQYTGESGGTPLRTINMHYNVFAATVGDSMQTRGDGYFNARMMPIDLRQTIQQGTTFTWAATRFTPYGKPDIVTRSSTLNASRTETTVYENNTTKWVLGQVKTVTESGGKVMVSNTYNATTANLETVSKFGHLEQTLGYYADGTLNTRKDGKNQTTTFSNYKRGIAQNVLYPNGTTESAVVDNIGNVTSLTDAANFTTTFGYTAGRLSLIAYPAGGPVAWNGTTIAFASIGGAEFDLPAGHWRQDITTGNARTSTYYDALWRAVYTDTVDLANTGSTERIVKRSFDFAGRTTFESYPKRTYGLIGDGVATFYDALGRVIQTSTNSDLGTLNTFTNYLTNFQKSTTDARGNTSVTSYQAFDEPLEAAITNIAAPLGVNVAIARDQVFGKTTSVTRSGGGKSATRSYVYDANERLCKTIEPETASTVQDYDLANNVNWRASGLALPSTNNCDTASVPVNKKVSFGYDSLNRLTTTSYSDNSPGITRTYTADGLPDTIVSNGATWTNTYNNRRLNERESLFYGGATYNIDRIYDSNGSLLQLKYPDSTTVNYNPNALGEPTQVGTYAGSITYHPNGAIAAFTYGNGLTHSMTQNLRGLPQQSTDGGVLSDYYTYDANANVAGITDLLAPSVSSRGMTYDNLDRLNTVSATNLWGSATYGYDALDNLTSTTLTAGGTARSTIHNFDPATNRLTSTTNGPAAYNFSYLYDSQGNITQRGSQAYVFDQGNRMSSATGKATYGYDGLGHRFTVVGTDGVNRVQVYSQEGQLLYVRNTSLPLATGTKYIYLHRHQIAEVKAAGAN